MKKIKSLLTILALTAPFLIGCLSCSNDKSYSELLNEEEKATNWFLSQYDICNEIPENGEFEVGPDAPFYRMDADGFLYMQVIDKGTPDDKPIQGESVRFRFRRRNIKSMYENQEYKDQIPWEGNADDMDANVGATSFVYGDEILSNASGFGMGIQEPLQYLNYNSRANLIIRSYKGFLSEQTSCLPYYMEIRYFKTEY